jgi:hypothetical protein
MMCSDKSLSYLAGLGYNVIRHPDATFAPLKLLGRQGGEFIVLGSLNQLIMSSSISLPAVTANQAAAEVNGQSSSSLKIGVGANVLGSLIGALGGNPSASLNYTDATNVEFQYQNVFADSIIPLDAGNYLKGAHVDAENLILKQYVLGNGQLYLIAKIIKSDKFTVKYTKNNGVDASVQIPVIQQALGGSISLNTAGGSGATITFQGASPLPFGFQCFQVGVKDGMLDMVSTKAGSVFGIAEGSTPPEPTVFISGLLEVRKH